MNIMRKSSTRNNAPKRLWHAPKEVLRATVTDAGLRLEVDWALERLTIDAHDYAIELSHADLKTILEALLPSAEKDDEELEL